MVKHENVSVVKSKVNENILDLLSNEGFIDSFTETEEEEKYHYKIELKYYEDGTPAISGIKRVSKPGLKIYVKKNDIPSYFSGMGVAVMSTSKGIMTGFEAKKQSLGGEVLFYIW
jgi:small subunit ribosomal protein S8